MNYYYNGGGTPQATASSKLFIAMFLGGFPEGTQFVDITDGGHITNKDPYWGMGGSGGAQTIEIGLYNNYRIKITTSGIYGWVGPGDNDFDLLGGGGGGDLNDLDDVVISTPADNELLAWDNGSSKWINQTAAEASLATAGHGHGQLHAEQHAMDSATFHTSSDVATLDASTTKHGFLKKLDNTATNFMNGQGNWAVPGGGAFQPPIGYITMFSGAWTDNVTIVGWYKCDGNNGTVNLVNKFVRGGATSGASGGSDNSVVVQHNHSASQPAHSHDLKTVLYAEMGSTRYSPISIGSNQSPTPITSSQPLITVQNEGVSGTGTNKPAYYTLIFIQRIS